MFTQKTPNGERELHAEHYDTKSIKDAVAREIARNIHITEELKLKYKALRKAQIEYRYEIQKHVTEMLKRM